MFLARDLPETIPLFPLPGALLLPRGRLPLHIFEPRYLAMLDDVLKTPHRLIGMIQPLKIPEEDETPPLHSIGCAGRISAFSEMDDGRHMITLTGISRFRLDGENGGFSPYLRASVNWRGFERDLGPVEQDAQFDRSRFLSLLARYFDAKDLDADWDSLKDAEEELLVNSLSMLSPFDAKDKQALLEAPTLEMRRETLMTLMDFSLRCGDKDEVMQ